MGSQGGARWRRRPGTIWIGAFAIALVGINETGIKGLSKNVIKQVWREGCLEDLHDMRAAVDANTISYLGACMLPMQPRSEPADPCATASCVRYTNLKAVANHT